MLRPEHDCYAKFTSVLHKETLKQHFIKNKISIKHLIKIINLGAKNCPVGRNGLSSNINYNVLKVYYAIFDIVLYLLVSIVIAAELGTFGIFEFFRE